MLIHAHTAAVCCARPSTVSLHLSVPGAPKTFFDSTRYPSDRRPLRVANLQLALDRFVAAGLPAAAVSAAAANGGVSAGQLVDGDREVTLRLLWRLILHFQLPQVRPSAQLSSSRMCRRAPPPPNHLVSCIGPYSCPLLQLISLSTVQAEVELVRCKAAAAGQQQQLLAAAAPAASAALAADSSAHVAALLEWARAVCAHFGRPVHGFGASFSDGSVFCLLVRAAAAHVPRIQLVQSST